MDNHSLKICLSSGLKLQNIGQDVFFSLYIPNVFGISYAKLQGKIFGAALFILYIPNVSSRPKAMGVI
jgi:hypothetical protein